MVAAEMIAAEAIEMMTVTAGAVDAGVAAVVDMVVAAADLLLLITEADHEGITAHALDLTHHVSDIFVNFFNVNIFQAKIMIFFVNYIFQCLLFFCRRILVHCKIFHIFTFLRL